MTHKIAIVEETLSDDSKVYDVIFGDIQLYAITYNDAAELAQKIMFAIHDHTNDSAEMIWPEPSFAY